jgi:hypothetical protein
VAHGAAPNPKDLSNSSGANLTLQQFAATTEKLVRAGITRAMETVASGAGWPPDWDALILRSRPT